MNQLNLVFDFNALINVLLDLGIQFQADRIFATLFFFLYNVLKHTQSLIILSQMFLQIDNVIFKFQVETPDFKGHLFPELWELIDLINFRKVAIQQIGVESLEFLNVKFVRFEIEKI